MPEILHRVGIRAPIADVFAALATVDGLSGWWTEDTRGDAAVGGTITFTFHDGDRVLGAFGMKVLERADDTRVRWQVIAGPEEWLGTTITFALAQAGDFVIVLFTHAGWREPVPFMHHCSTKWAIFLMSLKALVETGTGAPSPRDTKIDDWN